MVDAASISAIFIREETKWKSLLCIMECKRPWRYKLFKVGGFIIILLLTCPIPFLCWNPICDKIWDRDSLFLLSPWSWSHLEDETRGCTSTSHWLTASPLSFSFVFCLWASRESSGSCLCLESKPSAIKRNKGNTTFILQPNNSLELPPLSVFCGTSTYIHTYTHASTYIHVVHFLSPFVILNNVIICNVALSPTYLLAIMSLLSIYSSKCLFYADIQALNLSPVCQMAILPAPKTSLLSLRNQNS